MKNRISLLLLTLILNTFVHAQTNQDAAANLKAEIQVILQQLNDAALKKDEKIFDRYLAPNFQAAHQFNDRMINRATILKQVASGEMAAPPEMKVSFTIENLEIIQTGPAVAALWHLVNKAELNGRRVESRSRAVTLLVRHENTWKVMTEYGQQLPMPRTPEKVDNKILDAIIGEYQGTDGSTSIVTRERETLIHQRVGGPRFTLIPANDTTFYGSVNAQELTVTFVRNEEGKVTHLVVQNPAPGNVVYVRKKIK